LDEFCKIPSPTSSSPTDGQFHRGFAEMLGMVVITGITNASGIPTIFLWIKRDRYFEAFVGILTFL
jgi:hypothetical protein